jgi:hypothetical protein
MGYEYDFVFDWMVKKQNPTGPLKEEEEKRLEEDNTKMQQDSVQQ